MSKKELKCILCWVLGAIVWAVIAWASFSEGKVGFAIIQVILSVGFIAKAAAGCLKSKNSK